MLDSDKCPGEKIKQRKGIKRWGWSIDDVWTESFPEGITIMEALRGLACQKNAVWSLEVGTLAFTFSEASH